MLSGLRAFAFIKPKAYRDNENSSLERKLCGRRLELSERDPPGLCWRGSCIC